MESLTLILTPLNLAFLLGVGARALGSDLRLPQPVQESLSIYLLLAIGVKGGFALAELDLSLLAWPLAATITIGALTPLLVAPLAGWLLRLNATDAAAVAAHYGSVSAVTFVAALNATNQAGMPAPGWMTVLLAVLEMPGLIVGLALGRRALARQALALVPAEPTHGIPAASVPHGLGAAIGEALRSKSILLLVGGLVFGLVANEAQRAQLEPVFVVPFQGVLVVFLLGLGADVAERLQGLEGRRATTIGFGVLMPLLLGGIAWGLGHVAGLQGGGLAVFTVMGASASYIAAPAAVRLALPGADAGLALTLAVGVTLPFNLLFGIPLALQLAQW